MTEPYAQFDQLFWASARLAHDPAQVPYAELWRAAQLGFDEAFGRLTLRHHTWLAFLNRLWDAHRTAGLPDGPVRVPDHLWRLAAQDDAQGRLHRDLLEATGLRQPPDFDHHLECHLSLWRQGSLSGVVRAHTPLPEPPIADHTSSPTDGLAGGETGGQVGVPAGSDTMATGGGAADLDGTPSGELPTARCGPAVGGEAGPFSDDEPVWHADGPLPVDIMLIPTGWHVELTADLPGSYQLEVHTEAGLTITHQTPVLKPGQTDVFDHQTDPTDPTDAALTPRSVRITRRPTL